MDGTDTRTALIEHATHLVRSRGYSAFSFADLAAAVGIRKASVHHHFPTKEHLGIAVITRYTERFTGRLADIDALDAAPATRLARYADLYREGLEHGEACLCGMLAAETGAVPPALTAHVADFFTLNTNWLASLVADGQHTGDFTTRNVPRDVAAALLAALEGAVFLARGLGDITAFDQATATITAMLTTPPTATPAPAG